MNLDFVFDPTLAKRKALNFLWCFFHHPVEVIRLHERENLTAYATNMSGLDVPWRFEFWEFWSSAVFFAIGKVFLLTIWSMAGHTSPNNFVFLLVLFRLVHNREAKKTWICVLFVVGDILIF